MTFAFLQMPEDVFEHDDGVIDQARQGEGEAAEHHAVDGTAGELQDEERRQHRERDGEEDREGGAKAAEEDQDHQAGQEEADAAFMDAASRWLSSRSGTDRRRLWF